MPAELSVILPAVPNLRVVERTLQHLHAQTIAHQLEIIVITPATDEPLPLASDTMSTFFAFHIVSLPPAATGAAAYAVGVQHATAPIVALAEDHAFPIPTWASALLNAHRDGHAVVGPMMRNANPDTLVSWCDMLVGYGPWMEPHPGGKMDYLPGHNSSYKRDVLLQLPDLEAKLAAEVVLHWELHQQGHSLFLETAAITAHTNFSLYRTWLPPQYLTGRTFAASRSGEWPLPKRLLYALASPIIPFVRLRRLWPNMVRSPQCRALLWRLVPVLLFGLGVSAFGEMVGYLFRAGNAQVRLAPYEFQRSAKIRDEDRIQLGL